MNSDQRVIVGGFGVAGLFSFGPVPQHFGDLGRINLLAGKNNTGKSNVLRVVDCLSHFLETSQAPRRSNPTASDPLAQPHGLQYAPRLFLPAPGVHLLNSRLNQPGVRSTAAQAGLKDPFLFITSLLHRLERHLRGEVWFQYDARNNRANAVEIREDRPTTIISPTEEDLRIVVTEHPAGLTQQCEQFFHISGRSGGDLRRHWIPFLLRWLDPLRDAPRFALHRIGSLREATSEADADDLASLLGSGLMRRLQAFAQPKMSNLADRRKFETVRHFARQVMESDDLDLTVAHDASEMLVTIKGKVLPLERLGTGIHQVIVLASAATTIENSVVAIEEPETNLHPTIQRKLLKHLSEHTSNQYFITTHSAHILDACDASVFHLSLDDKYHTSVRRLSKGGDRFLVCRDLGYLASDLELASCVLWVEGPSDRMYIRHWIASLDNSLVEGVHYSIMFYGGRLLSHLTPGDPEVEDFISLRRLNRFVGIVIDSDKRSTEDSINPTKSRVAKELTGGDDATNSLLWITSGREIENYLSAHQITEQLAACARDFASLPDNDQFGNALEYTTTSGTSATYADKVRVARGIIKHPMQLVLDLKDRMSDVLDFIRRANAR